MNKFVEKIANTNLIWDKLNSSIPAKRRMAGTNFINFNCPMCSDRRMRCGVINNNPGVGVSCFNCDFKALWRPGEPLSINMRKFMQVLGINDRDIKLLSMLASQTKKLLDESDYQAPDYRPLFDRIELPVGAKTIEAWAEEGCQDKNFLAVADYMLSRGAEVIRNRGFYWTPHGDAFNRMQERLIIPFKQNGVIVGYTGRAVTSITPKYYNRTQPMYLYNMDALYERHRKYLFLVEGPFDAMAVDGIALLGAKLNDQQARWIAASGKTIIVVPDRDKKADVLIDIAVEHGWHVAFPTFKDGAGRNKWWESDVKDCAEAVIRYGKLWVIRSLLETATGNAIEIRMKRRIYS